MTTVALAGSGSVTGYPDITPACPSHVCNADAVTSPWPSSPPRFWWRDRSAPVESSGCAQPLQPTLATSLATMSTVHDVATTKHCEVRCHAGALGGIFRRGCLPFVHRLRSE